MPDTDNILNLINERFINNLVGYKSANFDWNFKTHIIFTIYAPPGQ
nr:hypothetical protein [Mucilaginibacter sp. SP1R1]